jgi:hypothetical protein
MLCNLVEDVREQAVKEMLAGESQVKVVPAMPGIKLQ